MRRTCVRASAGNNPERAAPDGKDKGADRAFWKGRRMTRMQFDRDEEWVEISDGEGRKASMRILSTVHMDSHDYYVLGNPKEQDGRVEIDGFLIVREDETPDGAKQYVVAQDEDEIERVVGGFVVQRILRGIAEAGEEEESAPCGGHHAPGEFCVCGDPELLQ